MIKRNITAFGLLDLLISNFLSMIILMLALKQILIIDIFYNHTNDVTNFLDNIKTIKSKIKLDLDNYNNLQNREEIVKPIIKLCKASLGACIDIVPDKILNKIKNNKIDINSSILSFIYNNNIARLDNNSTIINKNISYFLEKNSPKMELKRLVWGKNSQAIAKGVTKFKIANTTTVISRPKIIVEILKPKLSFRSKQTTTFKFEILIPN